MNPKNQGELIQFLADNLPENLEQLEVVQISSSTNVETRQVEVDLKRMLVELLGNRLAAMHLVGPNNNDLYEKGIAKTIVNIELVKTEGKKVCFRITHTEEAEKAFADEMKKFQ